MPMQLSFLRSQHLEHLRWRIRFVSHLLEVHQRTPNAECFHWLAQETTYLQHLQKAESELREHERTSGYDPSMECHEDFTPSGHKTT